MGVGVGLVTSEAPGQIQLSAVSRQATLRGTKHASQSLHLQDANGWADSVIAAAVTCQMRPRQWRLSLLPHGSRESRLTGDCDTDLRLVATEPCQGDAANREPCSYHGFMSLSDDLSSCSLIGVEAVDDHLRFVSLVSIALSLPTFTSCRLTELPKKTPYCNDTQMTACAEATGSAWGHHGSRASQVEASAAPVLQLVVVPLGDLKLGADAGYDGMLMPSVVPPMKSLAPVNDHKPIYTSPRGVRQASIYSEPVNGDGTYRSTPNDGTAAHLEAVVRVEMATETARNSVPGPRAPAQEAEPATSSSEQPGVSKPTVSGNKQLVGMAAALGTVMLIFVVWL